MDISRFEALAEAYGGDLRRWPVAERSAAEALLDREPRARAMLAHADALDEMLFASSAPQPSQALREAVLSGAPKARRAGPAVRRGFAFWLSGAGLAAAGMAGVLIGATATSAMVRDAQADALLAEMLPAPEIEIVPLTPASLSSAPGGFA